MRQWVVWACFLLYLCAYIPLIYLSNRSGLPPLAVLPVSTAACCIFSLVAITVFRWWKHIAESGPSRAAAWRASPATAGIVLLTPTAYAVAGAAILATMTLMKVGSIAVALPAIIGGAAIARRTKWAAALCVATVGLASYGGSLWSIAHGGPWLGGVLSTAGLVVAAAYVVNYGWRMAKMEGHKNIVFFVWEHLLAPHVALAILAMIALGGWALDYFHRSNDLIDQVTLGFTLWRRWDLWALGLCSQVVGLAGGWILIGRKVSVAAMVMNRSAALLAGAILVLLQGARFSVDQAAVAMVPLILLLLPQPQKA